MFQAMEQGIREFLLCWSRRGGKDFTSLDLMVREAQTTVANYWYALPQQNQVRKAVWAAVDSHSGVPLLDMHIPRSIIKNKKEQEMMIQLTNGSTIQFIGSDNPDALVGAGIKGVVASEAAITNPRFLDYIRPMLAESDGWELQNSTPRGRNHFYDEYVRMSADPECFVSMLTCEDMGHISQRMLDRERKKKSEGLFLQEYYCSFDYGLEGAVYLREMAAMAKEGRYCSVPYEPSLPVWIAWDIGFSDYTSLVFFQVEMGGRVRVIDHYQENGQKLKHFVDVIAGKPYTYGQYQFLPHDGNNETLGADSISRQLDQVGMKNRVLPRDKSLRTGIERTAVGMANVLIDNEKCKHLHSSLGAYRYEYDDKMQRFKDNPVHDWASDGSDSFRYALQAVKLGLCNNHGIAQDLDYSQYDQGMTGYG